MSNELFADAKPKDSRIYEMVVEIHADKKISESDLCRIYTEKVRKIKNRHVKHLVFESFRDVTYA